MKLRDLLSSQIREQLKKEGIDLPPIQFHVPPAAHHAQATKSSHQQDYYHNPSADFSKIDNFIISKDFINYIKSLENPGYVGYNKSTKLWMPHKSPEGGLPTIAYGHKMNRSEVDKMSRGISDVEANKLLQNDLETASRTVKSYISSHFGKDVNLSSEQMEMLTEFVFNLGSLNKFPKFTKSVIDQDWDTANREYKRSYVDARGKKHELSRRNLAFFNRYLSDKVA